MAPVICPLCSSSIKLIQIGITEAMYMCPNTKCVYPIGCSNENMEIIQRDYKDTVTQNNAGTISATTNKDDDLVMDFNRMNDLELRKFIQEYVNGENIEDIINDMPVFNVSSQNL